MIKCEICGSEHASATPFPDSKQGDDCAATVYQHKDGWFLHGSYGSSHYDGNMYLVTGPVLQVPVAAVCDTCITSWIKKGRIQFIREVF